MKLILVLLAVVVAASAEDYHVRTFTDLLHYHDECAKAHDISAEALEEYKHQRYADDEKSHCHVKCVSKKIGIFDDEHGLLPDNMVHQVAAASHKTEEEVRHVVDECNKEVEQFKSDSCLHAFKGFLCLRKHDLQVIERPKHEDHHEDSHKHDDHEHQH